MASHSIVEAVAPRDTPAERDFSAIVTENLDFVWRSLRRLGLSDTDAEDALQEVFLVASRRHGDCSVSPRAFLFRTAMHVAAHVRRSYARRREICTEPPEPAADSRLEPDAQLERARAKRQLERVLELMPLELRTVFVLFEVEELSTGEIADALGIPPGTVASRLRRARASFSTIARRVTRKRPEGGTRE